MSALDQVVRFLCHLRAGKQDANAAHHRTLYLTKTKKHKIQITSSAKSEETGAVIQLVG